MQEPKLVKIIKYCIYASAFVPLIIFSQFISPFHFGKVVVFRSLVEIMVVLYLLLIWRFPYYLPKTNKIFWSFLGFALIFSLTTLTSIQRYESFWGSLERMGGLWTFWHYFIFFVITTSIIRNKKDWFMLFNIMIIAGIISAFYGFGQKTDMKFFVGGGNRARIFGTIGNTALFAGYQLLILFLSLTMLLKRVNTKREKFLYGLGFIITSIAVLMTAVRGSVLALGAGVLLFFVLYASFFRSKQGKKVVLILTALISFFIFFVLVFGDSSFVKSSRYLTRLTDLSLKSYTVQTRFRAWQAGINGWNDSFKTIVLGWGPENFNIPFSKHFNPKFYDGPGSETLFDRAHNMFVEVLVTMGLMGITAYLGIFITIFLVLRKILYKTDEQKLFGVGLMVLTMAYVIHNSFIFDTSANFLTFFTILGFISFLSQEDNVETKTAVVLPRRVKSATYQFVGVLSVIVVSLLIYKTNILSSKANYTVTRAIIKGWNNDFNGAIEKYKKALVYNVPGQYEFRHRFALYVLEYSNSKKITPFIEETIKTAIEEVKKNDLKNKVDYLPKLYLARLNVMLGKNDPVSVYNDESLKYSMEALKISPTFVRTYYEIAQAYLNKKDFVKAVEYFKQAAELNSVVGLSYWYWGIAEFENKNIREAADIISKALDKGYQLSENDANRAVIIFLRVNDLKRLAYVFKWLVALKPNDPQYHASLAVAYANIGQIDEAVNEARIAVKLSPEFEAEAKRFVESLRREF